MRPYLIIIYAVLASMASGALHAYGASTGAWRGGTGMPDLNGQTYAVRTAEELAWVASESRTNDFEGMTIRLEADIDLGGMQETPANWTPIGSATKPFNGELDGNNHVIYNLYILSSLLTQGAGLIAETGTHAVIHHLGIGQGQIMTDGANNVGGLIGINRGRLHHCFNMIQLIAHNGNNVGGLVGKNSGHIEYCYNAGIITDAKSNVGGLVGYNEASAVLNNCYNMGYCKGTDHVGALFGKNEAPESQLTKVVFDQQLTRIYATGDGANDQILKDNTRYAIEKSSVFVSQDSPFYEEPETEWHYESAGTWSHPQLLCFKDHAASHVSVKAIWLDAEERPIERAEGVGTPKEGNSPRKTFGLASINHDIYGKGEWYSPSPEVIFIPSPTSATAQVYRSCGNQEVILTLTYDRFVKQIYTIVKGYETFDAGIADGHAYACWKEEGVGFKDNNKSGKEASGGKDDEQKDDRLSYQYRIIRDTVIREGDAVTYRTLDTVGVFPQEEYKGWCMPTDIPGEYAFRREVHDVQCKTEWAQTEGRLFLTVRKEFDAGELVEKPDTLYGKLPMTLTIESFRDASGGGEVFHYTWRMERSEMNAETGEWDPVPEDTKNPLYLDGNIVGTPSFDYTFTTPGQYSFTRSVKEESCSTQPIESFRPHIVYVYEAINPGSIENLSLPLCSLVFTDTIQETDTVSGGNGRYSYRWLCNGIPLDNSDTTSLPLVDFSMTTGQTYVFTRQVKDDTGLMDWLTSRGQVTFTSYGDFLAGRILASDRQICTATKVPDNIEAHIPEAEPVQGDADSEFIYCWLLYRGGTKSVLLDTIPQNNPILDATIPLRSYGLSVPVTVFVKRAVRNALCERDWKLSEDSVTWRFGKTEKKTVPVSICAGELPYDYEYTFADGSRQIYRFTADNQSYTIEDLTDEGCSKEVTLRSTVTPVPVVEVEPVVSVCRTEKHLKFAFRILSGNPNRFDLLFSQTAKEAGFRDSLHAILPASDSIVIPLPGRVPLGTQTFSIVFYTDAAVSEACRMSEPQTLAFSIDLDGYVQRKGEEILFVDNSGRHTPEGLTFVNYQWFRDGVALTNQTEQFIYEYPSLDGVYQVEMTASDGTVYRTCLYEVHPTTAINNPDIALPCRKVLSNGQIVLFAGEKKYTILGEQIR